MGGRFGGPFIVIEVIMSEKLRPKWTSKAASKSPVPGVDPLPIPSGVIREGVIEAEQRSEATPGAMGNRGNEANGDNPSVSDSIPFANGKDVRSYGPCPKSNPTPAMPGA